MNQALTGVLLLLALPAAAEPFSGADPKAGKALMDQAKCESCHSAMFSGDPTKIYTRADRRVTSASALLSQVRFCATQVKANWFPEEEENVAAYLNRNFYKFK